MLKYLMLTAISFGAVACNTVPDQPDFTMTLSGNYKAIADCATGPFRTEYDWTRTDLDTQHRVEFARAGGGSISGIISLQPGPGNSTLIVSRVQRAIYGKDFYANKYRPIFEKCASS